MKKIMLALVLLLLLAACGKAEEERDIDVILDELKNTKGIPFDLDQAIERIDEEVEKELYMPVMDEMYDGERRYSYIVGRDDASIHSSYLIDDNPDYTFPPKVTIFYNDAGKKSLTQKGKRYGEHLWKKALGYSTKINEDGFKGYYSASGAKMDTWAFNLEKAGYNYTISHLQTTPKNYENFDYISFTIDSLEKVSHFTEWDELKDGIISKLALPNTEDYRVGSFQTYYHYDDDRTGEIHLDFENDEVSYQLYVFKDERYFQPRQRFNINKSSSDIRKKEEEVYSKLPDLQLNYYEEHVFLKKLHLYFYSWEQAGLKYYLVVDDDRVEEAEDLANYEGEYIELIESVLD